MKKVILLSILACCFVGKPCFSECKPALQEDHVKQRTNTEVIFTYPSMFKMSCAFYGITMDELVAFVKDDLIVSDEFFSDHLYGKSKKYSEHQKKCLNAYFDGCFKVLKMTFENIEDSISCMHALSPTEQEYVQYVEKKLTKIKTKANKSYSNKNINIFMPGDLDSHWDFYDLTKKLSPLPETETFLWEMVWADVHFAWVIDSRLSDTMESIQRGTYP